MERKILARIIHILERIHFFFSTICYRAGMVFMALMTCAVLIQVFMRYVLSNPVSWIEEFCIYSMFLMVFLLVPHIVLKKLHISMTLFYDRIRQIKIKMAVNVILNVVAIFAISVIYPGIVEVVQNNWHVTTTQMPLTKGQLYFIIPVVFLVMMTVLIQQILEDIQTFMPPPDTTDGK